MANKLIQLTDGANNVYPKIGFGETTFTVDITSDMWTASGSGYYVSMNRIPFPDSVPQNARVINIVVLDWSGYSSFEIYYNNNLRKMGIRSDKNTVTRISVSIIYLINS